MILYKSDSNYYYFNFYRNRNITNKYTTYLIEDDDILITGDNFDNTNCECIDGYAGNNCQYLDSDICNGNGRLDNDGNCSCNVGYAGNKCQYSDIITCNNNGIVDDQGDCICYGEFTGDKCQTRLYFENFQSRCGQGYRGDLCQYSDAVTCNGYGTRRVDKYGACICYTWFQGDECDTCNNGRAETNVNIQMKL